MTTPPDRSGRRPTQRPPMAAEAVAAVAGSRFYPGALNARMAGRIKRKLGEAFGLRNFGVNLTELAPGAASALMHAHALQDEFLYMLEGEAILRLGGEEYRLGPGDCVGLPAGGPAQQLVNRSDAPARYLEIGDRTQGDVVRYPEDGLTARLDADGRWRIASL